MWYWNCQVQNQYVKTLVVRTVSLFPSLKLWCPGGRHNVVHVGCKIKCLGQQNSVYDAEMRLSGTQGESLQNISKATSQYIQSAVATK